MIRVTEEVIKDRTVIYTDRHRKTQRAKQRNNRSSARHLEDKTDM